MGKNSRQMIYCWGVEEDTVSEGQEKKETSSLG